MEKDDLLANFMALSQEEKKEKIKSVNNMIAREMFNRYSTYLEIDKQLQEKFNMKYERFRKSNRFDIRADVTYDDFRKSQELWEMAYNGINSLSDSLTKILKQCGKNN